MDNKLGFFKLTKNAFAPLKSSVQAAGLDLRSAYDYIVPKHDKQLIKTDLAIIIPEQCYGRIAPRSGLALNHSIDVMAGVIDRDYRGNVCVILFNHSDQDFSVKQGDKIAQIICEVIKYPDIIELDVIDFTDRNISGFGSTVMEFENNDNASSAPAASSSRFNIYWLLESLCIIGLNTVNAWESVVSNLKSYVNETDVEMLSIYDSLKNVCEYLKYNVGMDENSQLKCLAVRDSQFNFKELVAFLQNLLTTSEIKDKVFSPQASHCIIQIIRSILYKQQQQQEQPKKKKSKLSKRKLSSDESSDSDNDCDEFDKLFNVKGTNKKRKNKDVPIKQLLQINSEKIKKIMKSPGETGSYLVKIEVTDMKDLRNTPEKLFWTKVHKKAYFVTDEESESEDVIESIDNILLKVGKKLSKIPNVQIEKINNNKNTYGGF